MQSDDPLCDQSFLSPKWKLIISEGVVFLSFIWLAQAIRLWSHLVSRRFGACHFSFVRNITFLSLTGHVTGDLLMPALSNSCSALWNDMDCIHLGSSNCRRISSKCVLGSGTGMIASRCPAPLPLRNERASASRLASAASIYSSSW
jgi:hypothetical protein